MNTPPIQNIAPITARLLKENSMAVNVLDQYTGALRISQADTAAIHASQAFTHSSRNTLAIASSAYLLFITGALPCHMSNNILNANDAPLDINFFEAPTITSNGVALPSMSRNRYQQGTPLGQVYGGPTFSAKGLQLSTDSIYGGFKAGASMNNGVEWLLAPNTKYLFEVINNSGKSVNYNGGFDWLELPLPA